MWYRSVTTGKMIHSSSSRIVNHIFGEGVFDKLVVAGNLTPIEAPNVIDILRETKSSSLAIVRYHELHGCTYKEARKGVRALLRDMSGNKPRTKQPEEVSEAEEVVSDAGRDEA